MPITTENQTYAIQVIESPDSLGSKIKAILEEKGYAITLFNQPEEAFSDLESKQKTPYALIIANYEINGMKGDTFFNKARQLCPDSQRMLVADASQIQTLVRAINQANIHACLTLPLNNEDLINQVRLCCLQYNDIVKQKNLKRLTQRQNKQLFQIASSFKKKDDQNIQQLDKKEKEIRVLESRIRSAGGSAHSDKPVELIDILKSRDILLSAQTLGTEFLLMKNQIKQILETATSQHYIDLSPIHYSTVRTLAPHPEPVRNLGKKISGLAFELIKAGKVLNKISRTDVKEVLLEDQFKITLSENKTQAYIKVKTDDAHTLSLAHVKQFLEKNKIINGVKNDDAINLWLKAAYPDDGPFLIAMGRDPKYPKNAQIRYHFPTDYLHAGKVNQDGSMDFQDRGEIPYVEKEAFLAAKIFPEPGAHGIDVHGKEILVDEPVDLTFSSGPGTRISEDGVRIYAVVAGQPHLDAMGNISVCPEYQLKGDIGFETGDVNFDGNVVVSGKVKQGFKVQCASLTAEEIQGAEIDITGDLNVSLGIVDTELVRVKGSIQAKFIRNSKINAFGDLIIQKEIVDSTINLSGACINENGSIINSQISAKMGIRAGSIGNPSSKPSRLTVGVDEHARLLVAKVDAQIHTINTAYNELKTEIAALEKEDHGLHAVIAAHAHVQDRSQLELKDIEKKMENLKASGNMSAYQKVSKTVQEIKKNAAIAEEKINQGFDRQDEIELEISQKMVRIKEFEEQNRLLQDEKKRILEFSDKKEPKPEVSVARKIESNTRIFSENASLIISSSSSRCRIREYSKSPQGSGGVLFYELKIGEF
ncbi:MAG: flagellar assembly protein A [Pseudomonadota bacterium]